MTKLPINRILSNGISTGWITSPGPISGVAVQLNLSSIDRNLKCDAVNSVNDVDLSVHDPLKEESAHLGLMPFILEKFSFKKTAELSEKQLNSKLEKLIGSATAKSHRHSLLWSCSVPEEQIGESVKLLSELSKGPGEFTDEDITEIYQMLKYEAWEMKQELNFEDLLKDLIHRAAFSPKRTILSTSSPSFLLAREEDEERKDKICEIIIKACEGIGKYWKESLGPGDRFCVVGGGAEESSGEKFFEALNGSHFNGLKVNESDCDVSKDSVSIPGSAYCGGMVNWQSNENSLCNISIALKCPPSNDLRSHVPLAILQMLLGGGGSFSAGGPGKGMYSRLYTQMLNRYSWLEHARVFSQDYQSNRVGGLFGINASCLPERAPVLVKLMLGYLSTQLTASLTSTELLRAKNQLKSAMLMGLESRHLMLESYAQQLATGSYLSVKELCNRIDNTDEEDLVRVGKEMATGSMLSVACYGQTNWMPNYKEIDSLFRSQFMSKMK